MLVAGVGVNDSPHPGSRYEHGKQIWKCPIYAVWQNMLHRCYSITVQTQHPTYIGVVVCEEWFSFNNFRLWASASYQKEYELDKDILIPGSKVYSPETSLFVPRRLNLTLKEYHTNGGGMWPLGVTVDKGKYVARVNAGDRRIYIGAFECPHVAHRNWQKRKLLVLESLLLDTTQGSSLETAWIKIIDKLRSDIHNNRETKSFKEV